MHIVLGFQSPVNGPGSLEDESHSAEIPHSKIPQNEQNDEVTKQSGNYTTSVDIKKTRYKKRWIFKKRAIKGGGYSKNAL